MRRNKITTKQVNASVSLDIALRNVADAVEDELLVIDSDFRLRFANSSACLSVRKKAELLTGKLCYKELHGRDRPCATPLWSCPLKKAIETGNLKTVIHPISIFGIWTYLKITVYPLVDSHKNTLGIIESRRDVTAERELENQILRRHHQLSALSHISSAVSGLCDLNTTLRIALDNVLDIINGNIGGILLLDEETKMLHYHVQRGLSAPYADQTQIPLGQGIAGRVAQTGQSLLLEDISKDERTFNPYLISEEGLKGFISIPLKARDKVVGVMNVASHEAGRFGKDDAALLDSIGSYLGTAIEQASLYERLARERERYRTLLRHALTAQEDERKRIARELHDETSQAITSLTLSLQALIQMAEIKGFTDTEFMNILKKIHSSTVRTGTEIVRLMKELRPSLLDELGLPAAIHRYAKDSLQMQGIDVSMEFRGTNRRLPTEIEVTLFRVSQGLIGNILEHSGAKTASIKLEYKSNECLLCIEDDGKGFNANKLTKVENSGRGAGLFTLKERVRLIGGACRIQSQPRQGTKIEVRIPLSGDIIDEENKVTNS